MTVSYATVDEVIAWLSPASCPDDAELSRQIARASELIDDHVRARYSVDDDDLPTDEDIAATMRDAVCAQIEQWIEVGEANDVDGLAGTQISVDGYSGLRAPDLAPRARRLLKVAGLLSPVRLTDVRVEEW